MKVGEKEGARFSLLETNTNKSDDIIKYKGGPITEQIHLLVCFVYIKNHCGCVTTMDAL